MAAVNVLEGPRTTLLVAAAQRREAANILRCCCSETGNSDRILTYCNLLRGEIGPSSFCITEASRLGLDSAGTSKTRSSLMAIRSIIRTDSVLTTTKLHVTYGAQVSDIRNIYLSYKVRFLDALQASRYKVTCYFDPFHKRYKLSSS